MCKGLFEKAGALHILITVLEYLFIFVAVEGDHRFRAVFVPIHAGISGFIFTNITDKIYKIIMK